MATELYGLNPKGSIPKPDEPNWDECGEEEKKAYLAWFYNAKMDNTKGAFFSNPVVTWGVLWSFIEVVCDDILTKNDILKGHYNSWTKPLGGYVIGDAKAKKIAQRLRKMDDEIIEHGKKFPNDIEDCDWCDGTGKKEESDRSNPDDIICDSCNGKGTQLPVYSFRVDNVRNFIEFCENSGGFIIT